MGESGQGGGVNPALLGEEPGYVVRLAARGFGRDAAGQRVSGQRGGVNPALPAKEVGPVVGLAYAAALWQDDGGGSGGAQARAFALQP